MDQVKIGGFLKSLRKEAGKTQEEIAEIFGVSSRSVSRWENGNTMPDLGILVGLADYYKVDIREIIDGERKSEKAEIEMKETLSRVADYVDSGKKRKKRIKRTVLLLCGAVAALHLAIPCLIIYLFSAQYNSNGVSSLLCITIDESQPREYIGELENYGIYVEKLKTDDLYYTTVGGDTVSLRDAVADELVFIKDWRKKAWISVYSENTEILRYENYEIAITDGTCIIRPLT
ncbi:MAG: helix-turn-helix transcriptional regulator [Clostridia bacterium]|nr:helix-turn-helix transcriptional regulator [Clostridia bacterium]